MDSKEILVNDLLGKSTVKRRKAAIKVRNVDGLKIDEVLVQALDKEMSTSNWQSKVELLKTIGLLNLKRHHESIFDGIFDLEPNFDIVKKEMGKTYVRLKRKSLSDIDPVLELLEKGTYSVKEGALEALGYDKMVPKVGNELLVIKKCWNFGDGRPQGLTDPRYGLAAACAGWQSDEKTDFLNHCLESIDAPLIYVSKHSLNSKYVKLR